MQRKSTTISFKGQNIYAGIDVHLKNWKVTIMVENRFHKTISQDSNAETLWKYLRKNFPEGNYYSAYEAGFCGYKAHRQLTKLGINNIVVNPADIPTTDKEKKQKEDKRDSRKIAECLKNKNIKSIYIPTKTMEELRELVRYRKTLVKEISRNKCRIKSFLYYNGIDIPLKLAGASKYWSGLFTQWLKSINFTTPHGKMVLDEMIEFSEFLRIKLLKVNRELRNINKTSIFSKKLNLLQSIPGIALTMSMTLLTEMGSIERFKNLDELCSFVGLVPTTHSSSDKLRVGSITPRANNFLRSNIIESAWVASRIDPSLMYKYNELCKRMKPTEAIVRIAKKLLNRIRYVMKNDQEYEYSII